MRRGIAAPLILVAVSALAACTIVGTDTFLVHLAGEHLRSRLFTASPGPHTLHAATNLYAWPDKSVFISDGQSVTDTLPFYCS